MDEKTKIVKNSQVEMIEIVFPNDANPLCNIFSGRVMQLMDIVGSISAMRHARNTVGLRHGRQLLREVAFAITQFQTGAPAGNLDIMPSTVRPLVRTIS